MPAADTLRVNRAPVLTLWAAVVAGRLGQPHATALSLASAVAGTAAQAKARRLGLAEPTAPREGPAPRQATIRLLGREVPVVAGANGVLLAAGRDGRPAAAAPVEAYLGRAFGDRLGEVRAAMQRLAARWEPEELNRIGFRLYERFRPEVPEGVKGWGAKGEFSLAAVAAAADAA